LNASATRAPSHKATSKTETKLRTKAPGRLVKGKGSSGKMKMPKQSTQKLNERAPAHISSLPARGKRGWTIAPTIKMAGTIAEPQVNPREPATAVKPPVRTASQRILPETTTAFLRCSALLMPTVSSSEIIYGGGSRRLCVFAENPITARLPGEGEARDLISPFVRYSEPKNWAMLRNLLYRDATNSWVDIFVSSPRCFCSAAPSKAAAAS
jgi:hypothetical protein